MSRTKGNIRRRGEGHGYQINYLDATGKRRWKSFKTRKLAKQFLRREQAEADAVKSGLAAPQVLDRTFEDLEKLWMIKKAAKRSLGDDQGRIRVHIRPELGGLRLVDITPPVITRLEQTMHEKVARGDLSSSTSRKVLVLLKGMLRVAAREGWIATLPAINLPQEGKKEYKWLRNQDEFNSLLNAAQEDEYPGLLEFYATALYTGLRAGELCGLQWSDLDFELRIITVQRSYDTLTKSEHIRRVPLQTPLASLLREWKARSHSDKFVFPHKWGGMQQKGCKATTEIFHRCLERAGLPRITFHDLRHSFASFYMLKGGDIYRLKEILGHSTVKVTERYAHLSPAAFKDDHDRFGDFLPQRTDGVVLDFG
jgi:integrase